MSDKGGQRVPDRLLLNTRLALVIGFGGLLAIMALSGMDALRVLQQIRRNEENLRRQYLFKDHVLDDIRSDLYLSGTYVRDFLLDPRSGVSEKHRASLEEVQKHMQASLKTYLDHIAPEESTHYSELRSGLTQYWAALSPIVEWDAETRRSQGYAFLRDDIYPRRVAMLRIASQIANINEEQLKTANQRLGDLLLRFQTRLGVTLLATLALGLGMAAFSTRKILKLETAAHAQYEEVAAARSQLKDLSASLLQAQETERRALSRELHDEVGQSLSAVLVELRNLSAGLATRPAEQLRSHVEIIKELLENTIRVVRNMALLLRPSMLDDLGLVPALRWQAREVSKHTSMDVNVTTELASDNLPDEHKTCIYRVVQEALHNCSRHSRASRVDIRVEELSTGLSLTIRDDGVGFDVEQSKGLGLLGIEERVARLGGRCRLNSKPGTGTVLDIDLPLPKEQRECNEHGSETDPHLVSG